MTFLRVFVAGFTPHLAQMSPLVDTATKRTVHLYMGEGERYASYALSEVHPKYLYVVAAIDGKDVSPRLVRCSEKRSQDSPLLRRKTGSP